MTTPAEAIALRSAQNHDIRDENGRELRIRRINALDRLRLLKAAGPDLARNDAWLNMAALAFAVVEIDGTPRILPASERQIEAMVAELGDGGLRAIADFLNKAPDDVSFTDGDLLGNAAGTSN